MAKKKKKHKARKSIEQTIRLNYIQEAETSWCQFMELNHSWPLDSCGYLEDKGKNQPTWTTKRCNEKNNGCNGLHTIVPSDCKSQLLKDKKCQTTTVGLVFMSLSLVLLSQKRAIRTRTGMADKWKNTHASQGPPRGYLP